MKLLRIIVVIIIVFSLVGCKKNPASSFKNPKSIKLNTDTGSIKVTYDNDKTFTEQTINEKKILRNDSSNFYMIISFADKKTSDVERLKQNYKRAKIYEVIDNIEYNGYKGFAIVDKKYTTTQVYLYINKNKNIIGKIKISPININKAMAKLKKTDSAKKVTYEQKEVQDILNTIRYSK